MDGLDQLYEALTQQGETPRGYARLWLGTVKRGRPLMVEVAGTDQESDRLYCPPRLAPRGDPPYELNAGDTVLLLSQDDQTFFIIDKEAAQ